MTTKEIDRRARGPNPRDRVPVPAPGERCPRHHGGAGGQPCLLCAPHLVPVEFGGELAARDEHCETCQRPKYTPEDLERWKRELGERYSGPEPAWSRALCWTVRGARCHCKPLESEAPSTEVDRG